MPIYMQVDGIKSVTLKPYTGESALVSEVRKAQPMGVDLILLGQAAKPGFVIAKHRQGIIAVLIGWRLPAVQEIDESNSADGLALRRALNSSGGLAFVLGDGSVRPAFGQTQSLKRFQGREWSYLAGGAWVSGDPVVFF